MLAAEFVSQSGLSGSGIRLEGGESHSIVLPAFADGVLTVTIAGDDPTAAPPSFRFEDELRAAEQIGDGRYVHVCVELGSSPSTARLEITAQAGSPVILLDPVLGPRDVGTPRERPWPSQPDVVMLIADTFRGDNIGFSIVRDKGLELSPALESLASESVRFTAARAPATWTLPSHASIFAGRYPPELGIVDGGGRLADEVTTLAETFRAAGYRTVAITDAGYVSAAFGLAQGFGHYEETGTVEEPEFQGTFDALDRVLARDDGRPLLLFVHSYRSHAWVVDAPTRERLGGALEFQSNERFRSPEWRQGVISLLKSAPHGVPMQGPAYEDVVASMAPNYRGASAAAGAGFGAVIQKLRLRGAFGSSITVFTSDHGESLGEHGVISHGNGVWDPQALVPLLVKAPGIEPRIDDRAVGLIDLGRTLCSLAEIEPPREWRGIDLFGSAERTEPIMVFQTLPARVRYVAAIAEGYKLVFRDEDGPRELLFAYDLDQDPDELENRDRDVRGTRLEAQLRAELEAVWAAAQESSDATRSPELSRQLEGLGYAAPGSDR